MKSILLQMYIYHDTLKKIEVTDNNIHQIFKVKAIQKCQHCQLCVLWENSSESVDEFKLREATFCFRIFLLKIIHRIKHLPTQTSFFKIR